MATVVQSAYSIVDATSPNVLVLPGSATAGNMIVLVNSYVDFGGAFSLGTPTDANGTYQTVTNPGTSVTGIAVFYVPNCSSGTHSTTIQGLTGAPDGNFFCTSAIYEVSGLTSTPVDAVSAGINSTSGFGTSQATGSTGTLAQANEWALVYAGFDDNPGQNPEGVAVPSGYTVDPNIPASFQNIIANLGLQVGWKEISSTAALNPSFTWPSQPGMSSMVTGIATFKETASLLPLAQICL